MTAWYDLAGQSEYYASHEAVLHTIMSSSSPLILLLVDCRKSQDLIQQDILYWLHFFECQVLIGTAKAEPHLIIVFSFADLVSLESIKSMIGCCEKSLKSFIKKSSLKFIRFIALNCQIPNSAEMSELRDIIAKVGKELRDKLPINFLLHCFYAFLVRSFQHTLPVTIEEVNSLRHEWISSGRDPIEKPNDPNERGSDEEDSSEGSLDSQNLDIEDEMEIEKENPAKLIPSDSKEIFSLCEKLHDKGHLIVIKNALSIEKSYLIIEKEILLQAINASLFAPPNFKQHYKNISTSTGVVQSSTIESMFPDYNITMLIGFLVHLEYCQKITDKSIMEVLSVDEPFFQSNNEYLFFPGFVSITKPDGVWDKSPDNSKHCGWILQTVNSHSFFTPRFVQVLLLRVAFAYSFPLRSRQTGFPNFRLIHRACAVWKNGIYWRTETGSECLLEVTEECQAIILMFRCNSQLEGRELASHCFLRSSVISKILSTLEELCPSLEVQEYFCHPDDVRYPPLKCEEMSLIIVCDNPLTSGLKLTDLVQFEPLLFCDIGQLYHADEENENLSENFLYNLAESLSSSPYKNCFRYIIKAQSSLSSLKESKDIVCDLMKNCVGETYKGLRSRLSRYSIFGSRDPQVSILTF